MIIIEIILTIIAFKRGWKWTALWPVGGAILFGFFMGIFLGLTGGSIEEAKSIVIVGDIIAVIILIWMISSPKKEDK